MWVVSMDFIINRLTYIGSESLQFYWIPLLIWTIFAMITIGIMQFSKGLSARYRFHIGVALLTALPAGYLSYVILHYLLSTSYIPGSVMFIRIGSPAFVSATASATHQFSITVDTWVGLICFLLTTGILYKLTLIFLNQVELWKFHRKLFLRRASQIGEISSENHEVISTIKRPIHFAFVTDDVVPMTFGFFNTVIVIPDHLQTQPEKFNLAVSHELEHIQHHDYLRFRLLHIIKALFWFHPVVHFLERDIVLHREIDIDESIVSRHQNLSPEYAHLLLDLADQARHRSLSPTGLATHPSTIKKRIVAMTRSKKSNHYRWLPFSLPILTLVIALVMGCNNATNDTAKQQVAQANNSVKFRSYLNGGPLLVVNGVIVPHDAKINPKRIKSITVLKGKDAVQKYGKKGINGVVEILTKSNSQNPPNKMPKLIGGIQSIESRLVYPQQAKKAGIEGKVFVQFTVDKNGNIVDPHVAKGIGHGCDEAALDAVKQAKFTPGTKNGKPVTVKYELPIVFKL